MKTQISLTLILIASLGLHTFAYSPVGQDQKPVEKPASAVADKQTAAQADKQKTAQKDDVVKIGVTLVQVDVEVTDNKGHPVKDLKPEDFELYEDGRRQNITHLSYVAGQPETVPVSAAPKAAGKPLVITPSAPLSSEDVQRTFAFVVDDLSLPFATIPKVQSTLRKFVDEQMQPGDLVAIVRTGAGMGALQQFTNDKRLLYAAIERVRWNPRGGGNIGLFQPLDVVLSNGRFSERPRQTDLDKPSVGQEFDEFSRQVYAVGTLGALNFIVRGLRDLPGRKSVVLLSGGLGGVSQFPNHNDNQPVMDALHRLTDLANRASVVINTVDMRGLPPPAMINAEDNTYRVPTAVRNAIAADREKMIRDTQNGLRDLADETGGRAVTNSNDLAGGLKRVLDAQGSYYLLGYVPEHSTFERAGKGGVFHQLKVKVKRSGLTVHSRKGFVGVPDAVRGGAPVTAIEQLRYALISPFGAADVRLRLTSLFSNTPEYGSALRALLHIDARDLKFQDDGEGWRKAIIDVMAMCFGDNGQPIEQTTQVHAVRVRNEDFERALAMGLVYTIRLPIKKPGAYQLRIAVRDALAKRVGAANQFVEVADLDKGRLTLSGVVLTNDGEPASDKVAINNSSVTLTQPAAESGAASPQLVGPAVRRFRPDTELSYNLVIYNAYLDDKTSRPQLEIQTRLVRDGKVVYESTPAPINLDPQADWKRIPVTGSLKLTKRISPDEYMLQVIVTDRQAKAKQNSATQWSDFEIIN